MSDIFDKLLIYRYKGVGPSKYADLISQFGSAKLAAESLNLNSEFKDQIFAEMEALERIGGFYITHDMPCFPKSLKHSYNCPPILSVLGNKEVFSKPIYSCIGTRHASAAGIKIMSQIAARLAENDVCVASGLAIGTDTASHLGALSVSGNSNTIAVLAGGVDYCWPLENQKLYDEIIVRGAIISDMPVGTMPSARHFAQRNRIVAALAEKIILGESNEGSGSLITVGFASEFGRKVYAIPSHPTDPRSLGPNRLIQRSEAKLCNGPDDFFPKFEFNDCVVNTKTTTTKDKIGSDDRILSLIGEVPVSESVLAEMTGENVAKIKQKLVMLEMEDLVLKAPGGFIRKA